MTSKVVDMVVKLLRESYSPADSQLATDTYDRSRQVFFPSIFLYDRSRSRPLCWGSRTWDLTDPAVLEIYQQPPKQTLCCDLIHVRYFSYLHVEADSSTTDLFECYSVVVSFFLQTFYQKIYKTYIFIKNILEM